MAKDESKRLNPAALEADKNAFAALQAIGNYAPVNPAYTLAKIAEAHDGLVAAQAAEAQAAAALDAARDGTVAKAWTFHNLMLGGKDQVVAQFGRDSNEAQALGRKKPSEFRKRTRAAQKMET